MRVPEHPELIMNETILLNETYCPIIELKVLSGKFTDPNMMKFNWTVIDFTYKELLIQLNFENPNYISSTYAYPDSIQASIFGVQFFKDNLGNIMFPPTILKVKALPP